MAGRLLVTGGSGFIGIALINAAMREGYDVVSLDLAAPRIPEHRPIWRRADVTDPASVAPLFEEFSPTGVVHLAARADTDSEVLADYDLNVSGTHVVLAAARACSSVERFVHTSTQYVYTLGASPKGDEDYEPFTAYGESKVASEKLVRAEAGELCWTIVRPTNIWGPWHPRYPTEFWRVLSRGLYLHPSGRPVKRAYGYVGTVAEQMLRVLSVPRANIDGRVFYVGDEALLLDDWVDAFSVRLRGHPARRVPLPVMRAIATAGDVAKRAHLKAPLTSSRLHNMIEWHVAPMEPTFEALGPPRITMNEGVDETVAWLATQGFAVRRPAAAGTSPR